MPNLFTYGTLQDNQVQHYVFGKILKGKKDALPGFRWFENVVYGRYALVRPTENHDDAVEGMVYEVSEDDLQKCDVYETDAYTRTLLKLQSGLMAWVYVENSK